MRRILTLFLIHFALFVGTAGAQSLPTDGPLTIKPLLQKLGERLLKGKTGSVVAINPANGEILCLATTRRRAAMFAWPSANLTRPARRSRQHRR